VLDVDCILAAISSSTASSPGLLDGLPEAIIVQHGFQIVSNISFDI
ncbi:4378_t:CDS:1, partial [Gigaspora margarita]